MATTYSSMPQDALPPSQWAHDEYNLSAQPQGSPTFYTNGNTAEQHTFGSDRRHSASEKIDQESNEKYWIHRDKLAQIESREMAEAGIEVKRPTRSKSKASRSRSASRASTKRVPRHHVEDELPPPVFQDYDAHRNPIVDDYDHPTTGAMDEELQSDEAAEERGRYQNIRSTGRPSTSRIPVSRNSPAPVSTNYIERESPMNRSRNNSLAWHSNSSPEEGVAGQKFRPRSGSMTNYLREGSGIPRPRTPGSRPTSMHLSTNVDELNSSPSSNVLVSKNPNNNPASRKGSGRQAPSLSAPKQRVSSTNKDSPVDANRPRTSGGRVRSINRPEGEAPWIATMYKPDPMLPPDQQILPTHAKRMVSEQKPKEEDTQHGSYNIASSDAPQPIEIEQPIDLPASYKASPQEHFPGAWQPRPVLETIASSATNIKARRESMITGPTRRESIVMGPTAGTARRESVVMGPISGRRESLANSVAGSVASRSNSTYRIVPTIQKTPSLRGGGPGFTGRNASVAGSVAGGQSAQGQARNKADQSLWPPSTPDIHRGEKARKKEKGCGCCVVM